jgi:putative transposase
MRTYPIRRSQRLEDFDYSSTGYYAVTVCVQDRIPLFGYVRAGVMHLSPAGAAIETLWHQIAIRFPGVICDAVMVMPDHLHAILALDGNTPSLSVILQWFKGQSTARYVRGVQDEHWMRFSGQLWQPGFYDRVIRKDEGLNAVRAYIATNPERWEMRRKGT